MLISLALRSFCLLILITLFLTPMSESMVNSRDSKMALTLYVLCELSYFVAPLGLSIWALLRCVLVDIRGYEFFTTGWIALSQIACSFVGWITVRE